MKQDDAEPLVDDRRGRRVRGGRDRVVVEVECPDATGRRGRSGPRSAVRRSADPQRDLQAALAKRARTTSACWSSSAPTGAPIAASSTASSTRAGARSRWWRSRYVVVKVDVGRFDKNLDFAKLYGEPIRKGIPSVVVVTPTNEVVYQTKAGELADARSMGGDGIYGFFKDKADRPAGS